MVPILVDSGLILEEWAPSAPLRTVMLKRVFRSSPCHRPGPDIATLPSCRRIAARDPFRAVAGLVVVAACVLVSNDVGFAQTINENLWVIMPTH